MKAFVDKKLTMIVAGALPLTFKEFVRASTLLAFPDFCKEMLRVPSIKLLKHIIEDNNLMSTLSTVESFPYNSFLNPLIGYFCFLHYAHLYASGLLKGK